MLDEWGAPLVPGLPSGRRLAFYLADGDWKGRASAYATVTFGVNSGGAQKPTNYAGRSSVAEIFPALNAAPRVCIVISDPERTTPVLELGLQTVYGLTEAEARLAALLANGENLRTAAAQLGITYGTCRSRLAEIFQKTETRSQPELIGLLLKTLAV